MDLRRALLITLATTPLTSCYLHCRSIPEEQFAFTAEVSPEEFDRLGVDSQVAANEPLACYWVCEQAYQRVRGWSLHHNDLRACSFELPRVSEDGTTLTNGSVSCEGTGVEYICKGRRPLGHVEASDDAGGDALGSTLASMAQLEAASVVAFEQLAEQLTDLDAPTSLRERCRAAAEDERNHARWLTRLAARRGSSVREPTLDASAPDRLAIALHNAVEGCVHEAFAALVAAVVARSGESVVLRRIYARIADDETRHGQLAWDLHAWFLNRLPSRERELVEAAQREALERLPDRVAWLAELPHEFGPVAPSVARALARRFASELATAATLPA
ncbi:MAG TPA: ferritin-like domain-containing protein [Enhygromyxa sp.]|nr:ferritin-like domain-containing protein [Enhygromyxa sp.]